MQQLRKTQLKKFLKNTKYSTNEIVLILDNLNYAQNVAQIFRIADAFGVKNIYMIGSTTTPPFGKILKKVSRSKEERISWAHYEDLSKLLPKIKKQNYSIFALEITDEANDIYTIGKFGKIALLVGNEAHGVSQKSLALCEKSYFIPMQGKGASLNVSVATAVALSHIVRNYNS